MTHRGSRGLALLFLDYGTGREWGVSVTPRPLFTPGKDPVHIVQEAGCVPGPVWTGAENLTLNGIRSPDRPARSQSLYRLRYPAYWMLEGCRYFPGMLSCLLTNRNIPKWNSCRTWRMSETYTAVNTHAIAFGSIQPTNAHLYSNRLRVFVWHNILSYAVFHHRSARMTHRNNDRHLATTSSLP